MNTRERTLATIVLALVILGGGYFLVSQLVLAPLRARADNIAALKKEVDTKRGRITQIMAMRPQLDRWKHISLPADGDMARREYEKYLTELLRQSDFSPGTLSVSPRPIDTKSSPALPGGKGPVYTRLAFTIQGRGTLESLVKMMEHFYRTNLLQQIKTFTVQRPATTRAGQGPRDLDINIGVEALIVNGAENRPSLQAMDRRLVLAALDVLGTKPRGIGGLATAAMMVSPTGPLGPGNLAQPRRDYPLLAAKNVFLGPSPLAQQEEVDPTRFIYLTDITDNGRRPEAFLYDRYNNRKTRLRASAGFDDFKVTDSQDETIVKGHVLRIQERDVLFQVDKKVFQMHLGDNLEEAMRKVVPDSRIKELGLTLRATEGEKK
jgi:hypothetical protein